MADLPSAAAGDYAGDISPKEAWEMLMADADCVLIDVRTDAEFNYVGRPDLSSLGKETGLVCWVTFPNGERNEDFIQEIADSGIKPDQPVLFLCRSGVRSRHAAAAATQAGFSPCYNVTEGFEGDKDAKGHRGTIGGWKVAGLPWQQG